MTTDVTKPCDALVAVSFIPFQPDDEKTESKKNTGKINEQSSSQAKNISFHWLPCLGFECL